MNYVRGFFSLLIRRIMCVNVYSYDITDKQRMKTKRKVMALGLFPNPTLLVKIRNTHSSFCVSFALHLITQKDLHIFKIKDIQNALRVHFQWIYMVHVSCLVTVTWNETSVHMYINCDILFG